MLIVARPTALGASPEPSESQAPLVTAALIGPNAIIQVAKVLAERLGDEALVVAEGIPGGCIDVGGVEKGHPGIDCGVNSGDGALSGGLVWLVEGGLHAAKTDSRKVKFAHRASVWLKPDSR